MSGHDSAWKVLVDEWVGREARLRPDAPIKPGSVEVRDAMEVGDQAYVLVSYDVDYPWPSEEDGPGQPRTANTAVLQAMRVRQPWIERDATRALAHMSSPDGVATVSEHVLGSRRAYSGYVEKPFEHVTLHFDDGTSSEASVVDGWFLAVEPQERRLKELEGDAEGDGGAGTWRQKLRRDDVGELIDEMRSPRASGRAIYFSPLDLRSVLPLVRWQRAGGIVVVATSLERYDEGGVLRLRIDGVRPDDDLFVSWPVVSLEADGAPLSSGVCGESGLADTLSLDIGFRPWLPGDAQQLVVTVSGLRGPEGPVDPVVLEVSAPAAS